MYEHEAILLEAFIMQYSLPVWFYMPALASASILPIPPDLGFFIKSNVPGPFLKTLEVYSLYTEALYLRSLEPYHAANFRLRFSLLDPISHNIQFDEDPMNPPQEFATSIWSIESAMRALQQEREWMSGKSFDISRNRVVLTNATISRVEIDAQKIIPLSIARRDYLNTTKAGEDLKPQVNIWSTARSRPLDMHAAFLAALEAIKTAAVYSSDDPDPRVRGSRTFVTERYQHHAFLTIAPAAGKILSWKQLSWVARTMVVACVKDQLLLEGQAEVLSGGVRIASAALKMQQM